MVRTSAQQANVSDDRRWVRLRTLPDAVLADLPEHVRRAFEGAAAHNFEVEVLRAHGAAPEGGRARRRLVIVADDARETQGPIAFDLAGLARDVRACCRAYVIAEGSRQALYDIAYANAVDDLAAGFDSAIVVETRPALRGDWARALAALRASSPPHELAGRA